MSRKSTILYTQDRCPMREIEVVQADTGRELLVNFYDLDLSEFVSARIYTLKPDRTEVYSACTIDGNLLIAPLTSQALAIIGKSRCQIQLMKSDGKTVTCFEFVLIVKENLIDESAIESSNEYTALTILINKADTWEARVSHMETDIATLYEMSKLGGVVVDSIEEMTDTTKVYILRSDGLPYYYNGSQWVVMSSNFDRFVASHGSTSYNDVMNAYNGNKLIYASYSIDGEVILVPLVSPTTAISEGDNPPFIFSGIIANKSIILLLTYQDGWGSNVLDLAETGISLKRLGDYAFEATYAEMPVEDPSYSPILNNGGCSSFIQNGKLYRNFDFNYNEGNSFHIVCPGFEGTSFTQDAQITNEIISQLPYHVVDGVNNHGIMVSTHILYNDWNASNSGSYRLTKLPFLALTNIKSMETIETDMEDILTDLSGSGEYLIQVLVSDGTTTCLLRPLQQSTLEYEIVDISALPKLTNFYWYNSETVSRTDASMQTRPTGIERWNMIPCDLKDLRFTKCYEENTRLSEFIGVDDTTKASTDAELEAIYTIAHAAYETRTRDGSLWHTMHSVVYDQNGLKEFYTQENWDKNYASVSGVQPDYEQNDSTAADYIKNRPFYEGEITEHIERASSDYDGIDSDSPIAYYYDLTKGIVLYEEGESFEATIKILWHGDVETLTVTDLDEYTENEDYRTYWFSRGSNLLMIILTENGAAFYNNRFGLNLVAGSMLLVTGEEIVDADDAISFSKHTNNGIKSLDGKFLDLKTVNGQSIKGSGNLVVQEKLVSGTNIKTFNGQSLLGDGNVSMELDPPLTPVDVLPAATKTEYDKYLFYLHEGKVKHLNKESNGTSSFEQLPDLTHPMYLRTYTAHNKNHICAVGKYIYYPGQISSTRQSGLCVYNTETGIETALIDPLTETGYYITKIFKKDDDNLIVCASNITTASKIYIYNISTNTATLFKTFSTQRSIEANFASGYMLYQNGILYSFSTYYTFPAYLIELNMSTGSSTYTSVGKDYTSPTIVDVRGKVYFNILSSKLIHVYNMSTKTFEPDITYTANLQNGRSIIFKDRIYHINYDNEVFIFDETTKEFSLTNLHTDLPSGMDYRYSYAEVGDDLFFFNSDDSSTSRCYDIYKLSLLYSYNYETLGNASDILAIASRVGTAETDIDNLETDVSAIEEKISSYASASNKLVSESEMGDAISLVEAKQLYKTSSQGSFATKAELTAATTFYGADGEEATPTRNDVAYVLADESHSGKSAKYVIANDPATDGNVVWGFVITFSDSTFTQAQMDAINSNITNAKREGYDTHVANNDIHVTSAQKTKWDDKQDAISDLETIRSGAAAGARALQPSALDDYYTKSEIDTALGNKQATLESGTNIKTIQGQSVLGSGNIDLAMTATEYADAISVFD